MVSLGAIEEKISKLLHLEDDSLTDYVVTSIEDEKKGEKIILLISHVNEEQVTKLKEDMIISFDNKLMIPSTVKIVDEVPKLGSGKKDFKGAKNLALSLE